MRIGQDGETALEIAEKENKNDAADAMKSFTVNYVCARVFVCCGVCFVCSCFGYTFNGNL